MSMPLLATFMADADSSSEDGGLPRLRDLIIGLLSGDISAASIFARLNPHFSDEVRAFTAHRGIPPETFLANALMAFALDVADESWRQAVRYREAIAVDAEAETLAELLARAMRQRLDREISISWHTSDEETHVTLGRRIG